MVEKVGYDRVICGGHHMRNLVATLVACSLIVRIVYLGRYIVVVPTMYNSSVVRVGYTSPCGCRA